MSELPHVEIATDGACKGNPGPGGWGAVIRSGGAEKLLSGAAPATTNNRMELTAAIEALAARNVVSVEPTAIQPIRFLEAVSKRVEWPGFG